MPSQKILTVVGATGNQGGSLITAALQDGTYAIRGITRNVNSAAAKALAAKGVEMVTADLNSESSLVAAFHGSSAIFAVTDFFEPFAASGPEEAIRIESAQGINLARAASQTASLEHYIWSTLPNAMKISGGKYRVPHFESKNKVDDYIKADSKLLAKTTFLWFTFYPGNYLYPMFTPNFMKSSGKYIQLSLADPSTPLETIGDTRANVGVFALAVLKKPAVSLPGKFVLASTETVSAGEMLQIWGKVAGKETVYVKVTSLDDFDRVWPMWGGEMGVMMAFWDEYREKSWSGEDGIVTRVQLGLASEKLVGLKQAFEAIEWATVV